MNNKLNKTLPKFMVDYMLNIFVVMQSNRIVL